MLNLGSLLEFKYLSPLQCSGQCVSRPECSVLEGHVVASQDRQFQVYKFYLFLNSYFTTHNCPWNTTLSSLSIMATLISRAFFLHIFLSLAPAISAFSTRQLSTGGLGSQFLDAIFLFMGTSQSLKGGCGGGCCCCCCSFSGGSFSSCSCCSFCSTSFKPLISQQLLKYTRESSDTLSSFLYC